MDLGATKVAFPYGGAWEAASVTTYKEIQSNVTGVCWVPGATCGKNCVLSLVHRIVSKLPIPVTF